ncbi:MAG: hypothetical protein EPO24_10885 [Bacteroidetes bacterium]|nr:MAG: hypothetical protein EPO24_10885 [Bacteroidota bacterium]
MPTDLIWKTIHSNFKTLLDTTLSGMTYNALKESEQVELSRTQAASTFNGAYSIQLGSVRNASLKVNSILDYELEVLVQLAFELNKNAGRTSYNNAINDVETVIKHRLAPSSYEGTLLTVSLQGGRRPQYIHSNTFVVFEVPFVVTGRIQLA